MKKLFILFIVFFIFASIIAFPAAAAEKIQYDLAYPGILPDNPLYKLKVLRNKLMILLINDPNDRIDFYLLQADKGIHSAAILLDKKKTGLAKETLFKAEHNITLLTYELGKFKRKPKSDFFNKLETASLKHQELIGLLMERAPAEDRNSFETVLNFSKTNLNTITRFKNKKFFQVK